MCPILGAVFLGVKGWLSAVRTNLKRRLGARQVSRLITTGTTEYFEISKPRINEHTDGSNNLANNSTKLTSIMGNNANLTNEETSKSNPDVAKGASNEVIQRQLEEIKDTISSLAKEIDETNGRFEAQFKQIDEKIEVNLKK